MDSIVEAEYLVIDPTLLAKPQDRSQYNPDFNLGFDEWLAMGVFEQQLNKLRAYRHLRLWPHHLQIACYSPATENMPQASKVGTLVWALEMASVVSPL